jgi:hypothetical protein
MDISGSAASRGGDRGEPVLTASEGGQAVLPDFTLWQWKTVPGGGKPSDDLYKELYVVWPGKGKSAVRCRLCSTVVSLESGIFNFKIHLGWCHPYFLIGEDRIKASYGGA